MAWQMPPAGQWGAGIAMPPDLNMGSYTPEQWTAIQQQNWQQWAQWQQQYAQWHGQYGDKYTEQMQAIQALGGMPPLPVSNAAPPPAPPPPDKPPPPPHENNQPLYGHTPSSNKPAPVPPPTANQPHRSSSGSFKNPPTQVGNNSNWSNNSETSGNQQQQSMINAEALKKLAEEERLFDIQFQKWEEEIKKWKQENVNHPDKQAYKEYENKFEACRAQLMERRQQMKLKRARLTGTSMPPDNVKATTANNTSTVIPPSHTQKDNTYPIMQQQNYQKKPQQNYLEQGNAQFQRQQYNAHNRSNNLSVDPQDRYESYHSDNNYPTTTNPNFSAPDNATFLATSKSAKGIPGLDLVPEHEKGYGAATKAHDVIDITSENDDQRHRGPDYSTISKGINNILGDEKIMNILSMVHGQNTGEGNIAPPPSSHYGGNNQNNPPYNQGNRNQNYNNQQYDNRPNVPFNRQSQSYQDINRQSQSYPLQNQDMKRQGQNYPMQNQDMNRQGQNYPMQNQDMNRQGQNYPMQNQDMNRQGPNFPMQNNDMNRQGQSYPLQNQDMIRQGPNYPMQNQDMNRQSLNYPTQNQNMNRQSQNYSMQNQDNYPQKRMYDDRQDVPQNQFNYNQNTQQDNSSIPSLFDNVATRPALLPPRPDVPAVTPQSRPFIPDIPSQQNANNYPQDRRPLLESKVTPAVAQASRPKWVEEPLFTPSILVEYEHKPLRLKARDFIEPVHVFEYNHIPKDGDVKKVDFEKEADALFTKRPKKPEKDYDYGPDRYVRDHHSRDFERRVPKDDYDLRARGPRDEYDDRRRPENKYDDRRRDDREKYGRRDDFYREHRGRDSRKDDTRDFRHRSRSRERDMRKRALSKDSDLSNHSATKKPKEHVSSPKAPTDNSKHIVMIDDILEPPGREIRPAKIVIVLRGPPGSGKSYLAKLIRDREAEYGGTVRIMSIDDYFMQEGEMEEKDTSTGKIVKKPTLKYEYDEKQEETYLNSLKRAFKRSLTDGYFSFLIYDAVNDDLKSYADIWNFARQNGFQVYICTMESDAQMCFKRNIHNRSLEDIQVICARFFPTPAHHIQLDATTLLQSAAITEVQMEDADTEVIMEDAGEIEVENVFASKWEKMDDAAQLARLDGTNKPLRSSQLSMEDYLQLADWKPNAAKPGKKTVRWADIEERRQQEKMRAIGFVVGQTDWNRMTDPTMGSSALTQTKYIERVRRNLYKSFSLQFFYWQFCIKGYFSTLFNISIFLIM